MMAPRLVFALSAVLLLGCKLIGAEKEPVDVESIEPDVPSVQGNFFENAKTTETPLLGDVGFIHAFVASLSVIIVSELGDKTFFIAAIMAMRHPRITVFAGAIGALALMTVLSAVFGWAVTIIPRIYTYYISTALFAIFGIKMLKEGYSMSPNEGQEEFEEVQLDLRKRDDEYERESSAGADVEVGGTRRKSTSVVSAVSRVLIQSFTLTFLAEWGDRSQLATIILAAREDVVGVTLGGILGHALCTGLAVIGGRFIAQKISVRTVTIIGGIVFLLFAVTALFFDPTSD
ncbi:transmembrane protein 165 [Neocloeon triangulifer]|uniref:transmembrane protein 165 n=1 Tax=Neocloeon triangulifer TaxID=2078957 RepID=UPI00286F8453|nr:transmembrane protein 165 [Neocloeon triangulifer]